MFKKANLEAYALALYELSMEMQVAHETSLLITSLYKEIKKDKSFINYLRDNEKTFDQKYQYIDNIFADFQKNQITKDFLKVVVEHKAINHLQRIISTYLKLVNNHLNIKFAKIYSAFPISEEKLNLIKEKLEKDYNCLFDIENKIDPNIISGFKIRMDSYIIENSIGSKLNQLTNLMKQKNEGGIDG
ncbi:ATP synthase F1 subunit delta [Mycoplasma sp. 1018B]|uniref:ATP synthase F1 subunit delta n=1 Tax=Mycoplasma sp. 1018B TaxID=2967302 RepID=UPI00211BE4D2|nr:ATP synthase F1 subunit delta [Mycoplasma sp. 1018B]UUM19103.1 ATP synthase F1 subunit delta [Mycoplasma sp. 1018B]